ncbi:MAG: hypothetical protein LBI19_03185 [Oscillospiraceae bacterium]|nr:hypothetical protein [Oscillospiraceae bacterium]
MKGMGYMQPSYISSEIVLTPEQKAKFEKDYQLTADMQKTGGQVIIGIIKKLNMTEARLRGLAGLNRGVRFDYTEGVVQKRFIISVIMALGLNVHAAAYILQANGMTFNTNDRTDRAYIYLIEEHKGKDIETCNAILRDLGVETKYFLGSQERGAYRLRKQK